MNADRIKNVQEGLGWWKQMAKGRSQIPVAQCTQPEEIHIVIHFDDAPYHKQCFNELELLL